VNEDVPSQSSPGARIEPKSVAKVVTRTFSPSYETSIGLQNGARIDPVPAPWGENHATTVFMSNWWRDNFVTPASCITYDKAESLRTGKIYIPRDKPYRLVMNFEDSRDSWAAWPFEEMERYRDEIKKAYPHLTISAYVAQAYNLLSDSSKFAVSRIEMLRKFASKFDEISPSLYYHETDDVTVDWSKAPGEAVLSMLPQWRVMRVWERSIAPGKPLSPCVWWFVTHRGYKIVTRDQFWKLQVGAARSSPQAKSVILWGNVASLGEQRIFDAGARPVISG